MAKKSNKNIYVWAGVLGLIALISYLVISRIGNSSTASTTNPSASSSPSVSSNPSTLVSPSTNQTSSFLPNESGVSFSTPSELPSGGSLGISSSDITDSFNTMETYAPQNTVNNVTNNSTTTNNTTDTTTSTSSVVNSGTITPAKMPVIDVTIPSSQNDGSTVPSESVSSLFNALNNPLTYVSALGSVVSKEASSVYSFLTHL